MVMVESIKNHHKPTKDSPGAAAAGATGATGATAGGGSVSSTLSPGKSSKNANQKNAITWQNDPILTSTLFEWEAQPPTRFFLVLESMGCPVGSRWCFGKWKVGMNFGKSWEKNFGKSWDEHQLIPRNPVILSENDEGVFFINSKKHSNHRSFRFHDTILRWARIPNSPSDPCVKKSVHVFVGVPFLLSNPWENEWFDLLVGGWTNPFEKYARQNGNLPHIGMKIKNIWNQHLVLILKVPHFGDWHVLIFPWNFLTASSTRKFPSQKEAGSSSNQSFSGEVLAKLNKRNMEYKFCLRFSIPLRFSNICIIDEIWQYALNHIETL